MCLGFEMQSPKAFIGIVGRRQNFVTRCVYGLTDSPLMAWKSFSINTI